MTPRHRISLLAAVALSATAAPAFTACATAPAGARAAAPAGARAAAHARGVRVPHVSGDLSRAYVRLHRAGLRVTLRSFTLAPGHRLVVTGVTPQAGSMVRTGSAVRLTIAQRSARPSKVSSTATLVPRAVGYSLSTISGWASGHGRRLVASVGPLTSGGASQLLFNFRVTRQTPAANQSLTGAHPLTVAARQGVPAPCTPPLYGTPVVHDAVASVSMVSADVGPGATYYGCVTKVNRQKVLTHSFVSAGSAFGLLDPAIGGTEFGAVRVNGSGTAGVTPNHFGVQVYNLMTGSPSHVYDAGTSTLDALAINASGFTAWHQVTAPAVTSSALTDVSCPSPNACVAVDNGGSVFTSTSPSGGRSAWAQTKLPGASSLTGVSCATPTECVAVGGNQAYVTTNPGGGAAAWTATAIPGANLSAVACPSASLCVAVGANGIATSTAPTAGTWTFGTVPTIVQLASVACPSAALCVAADGGSGNIVTTTAPSGGAANWSVSDIDGSQPLSAVSCASVAFCVVDDPAGDVLTSGNPSGGLPAWQLSHVVNTALERIACPSSSLCVAATPNGIATSASPTGGAGAWSQTQIPGGDGILGVSCPSVNLCVAVNQHGEITTSANPTGGTAAWGAATVDAPACAAAAGCDTEQIGAHDSSGLRTLDTTGPGSGTQLQSLTLTDNQLTWTHDGAPESATLG